MKYFILAIFFSAWTIVFGILNYLNGSSLIGPILTGISAVGFWISFFTENKEKNN